MKKSKTAKELWDDFKKRNYQGQHPLSAKKTNTKDEDRLIQEQEEEQESWEREMYG